MLSSIGSLGKKAQSRQGPARGHLADWPSPVLGSWDWRALGYQVRWPRRENYVQLCPGLPSCCA